MINFEKRKFKLKPLISLWSNFKNVSSKNSCSQRATNPHWKGYTDKLAIDVNALTDLVISKKWRGNK